LLLFDGAAHVVQTLLKAKLKLFLSLHFFTKSFLVLVALASHLLVVKLEVLIERVDLFFLSKCRL